MLLYHATESLRNKINYVSFRVFLTNTLNLRCFAA